MSREKDIFNKKSLSTSEGTIRRNGHNDKPESAHGGTCRGGWKSANRRVIDELRVRTSIFLLVRVRSSINWS